MSEQEKETLKKAIDELLKEIRPLVDAIKDLTSRMEKLEEIVLPWEEENSNEEETQGPLRHYG